MAHQREVRLGIVLYGGVSLAVYENGVAQELHRALSGTGVYGLIQELIDSDIVVDIISGTSAGGVNGIMLAYALANKMQFAPSAELWRNQGDIMALLRTQRDGVATSVLNSAYYQEKLQDCFAHTLVPDPSAPDIDELDLFITGTDANGDIYTVYDDDGHAIDVKNHRALFKLAYRKGRKNDLASATPADLAKLARITSCFPVAFEPVTVESNDTHFFRWGKLRRPSVYMDGGILNNKPFTSTINEIARRTATRDVERFLIYVEPDPEVFIAPSASTTPPSPSVATAAFTSLMSIPGYQSIAADLEEIQAHNERATRMNQIFNAMPPAPDAGPECLDEAGMLAAYGCDSTIYYAMRLIQLRDTAVGSLLNDDNGREYIPTLEHRRSGRILVESFDNWPGDAKSTLTLYDVFFRMRRASHLSDSLMRSCKAGKAVPDTVWAIVNHYFKLYEITEWAMIGWLNHWNYDWRRLSSTYPQLDTMADDEQKKIFTQISTEVWGEIEQRLNILLQAGTSIPTETTDAARSAYYDRLQAFLQKPAPNGGHNLLDEIDASFKSALKGVTGELGTLLRNEFCRFADVDRQLFPIEFGSGFESTNPVRVVRFSPRDAQRGLSKGRVSDKVCGLTLSAFGGFFKKSWRANDIMVGRLDAACLLTECLLTKERLAALPAGRTVTVVQLQQWLHHLDDAGAAALAKTINTYLEDPRQATTASWNQLVDAVVEAYHDEIQRSEWPRVVRCALEQEYAWGRYRKHKKTPTEPYDAKNLVWSRGRQKPDQVLASVAANAIASGQLPPFTPGAVAGRSFLEEIPDTVLQEISFLGLIRMGKSLMASIEDSEKRKRLEGTKFYDWPFEWILPILYKWARMRRTQPDSVIIFNTAVPTFCLAALIVDAVLFVSGVHPGWRIGLALVGGPVALFALWAMWFRK